MIRAVLVAPLRHHIEEPVNPEKRLPAAAVNGIGVEYLASIVFEENAVAGEIGNG
jgi:hypothetical protein